MPARNQQEPSKGYHGLDVAQINSHIGLAYGAPFQGNPSGAPMMMGGHHPPPSGGNMGGYPAMPASRYMSAQAGAHPSVAGTGSGASNQYAPPFSSAVAGMMAQFPSPG